MALAKFPLLSSNCFRKFFVVIRNFFAKFFPFIQGEVEDKKMTEMKNEESSDVGGKIAPTVPSTDSATHEANFCKLIIRIDGSDGRCVEVPVPYYPDESEKKPLRKTRKTALGVVAVASTLIAAGVTVISSNSSPLTSTVKVLWYTVLAGSQVASIASVGAFFLQHKRPKVAPTVEKIGLAAVVLSVIGMATASLPSNFMWVGSIPTFAFLIILAAAR